MTLKKGLKIQSNTSSKLLASFNVNITRLSIPEIMVIEPEIFYDDRGCFFESFNQKKFNNLLGREVIFVQDNFSKSKKGVLRGLHYQIHPNTQEKLVRVLRGKIFVVALDIRDNSKTKGKWTSYILTAEDKLQIWVPEGFAHGYLTLADDTEVFYKTSNFYHKENERGINPFDKRLKIDWPYFDDYLINERDKNLPSLT